MGSMHGMISLLVLCFIAVPTDSFLFGNMFGGGGGCCGGGWNGELVVMGWTEMYCDPLRRGSVVGR